MQGIVTDEKGTKVKAAIVVLLKVKEPEDVSEAETATYIETDEEGRFMIRDLNPEDKYFIEIYVERSEAITQNSQTVKPEDTEPEDTEPEEQETEKQDLKEEEPEEPEEPEYLDDLDESDPDDEMGDPIEEKYIIDSLMRNPRIEETTSGNISVNNLYFITDVEQKDKLYLYRNNFW